ncbi:hypothetical protein CAL24_11915 [Bordetella genomosp. 2]|uniref:DUF1800 domain-containing protein n=2 Tax=Bordetella genomosp. 2 TaxID=1983456 RepID=A0A261VPW2_9BORD|nr:hypothetical protein CAL24_11915 [Bordetella genomosp. 2]
MGLETKFRRGRLTKCQFVTSYASLSIVRNFLLLLCASLLFPFVPASGLAAQSRDIDLPLPALVDRLTWGATSAELAQARQLGARKYILKQLKPDPSATLPEPVRRHISALSISKLSAQDALIGVRRYQVQVNLMPDGPQKTEGLKEVRRKTRARLQEAAQRATWRALYSPNQLHEQMSWFWFNHFNIYGDKGLVGAVIDDYEDRAIRPYALGKFRDLLEATMRSPAMLIYLDNQRNRHEQVNENYARELMELHTLGLQGGYTQKDVQELARILTGMGVLYNKQPPRLSSDLSKQLVHQGAFLFNPAQHDFGTKNFLGQQIKGEGYQEIKRAIDILSRHPATARHISTKLAEFFVADDPPRALIDTMAKTFQSSDGDIAATLQTMFFSEAFAESLEAGKFKDPVHYTYSALRLAYANLPPLTRADIVNDWLQRMGQPWYGRLTPDGYPLARSDWSGSGQMVVRFDLARQIASTYQVFYRAKNKKTVVALPALPRLLDTYGESGLFQDLSPATRQVVSQAETDQAANMYLLASPEFMLH